MKPRATSIGVLLKRELQRRQQANPKYSLRTFAAALQIDPSSLSKILKGMRVPSDETRARILRLVHFDESEVAEVTRWLDEQSRGPQFETYNVEIFERVIEPEHLIALEALRIPGIASDPNLLGPIAGLDAERMTKILNDLESIGLVGFGESGAAVFSPHNSTFTIPLTGEKRKRIQRQFLEGAERALETLPIEIRENSTLTIAIAAEQLPEYKAELARFRARLNKLGDKRIARANTVYNFVFSVYPASVTPQAQTEA